MSGRSNTWVSENSACRIDSSWRVAQCREGTRSLLRKPQAIPRKALADRLGGTSKTKLRQPQSNFSCSGGAPPCADPVSWECSRGGFGSSDAKGRVMEELKMTITVKKIVLWRKEVENRPGALAATLDHLPTRVHAALG